MTSLELPLRIGTRRSLLARAQAQLVSNQLRTRHEQLRYDDAIELVLIQTTGDRVQDRPLAEIGGKGLFTKEIDVALLDRRIDIAIHSMKDVPTILPDSLTISCFLPREDPRDALISGNGQDLANLPSGSLIGTSSLRRRAQILAFRPDLMVGPLRGNVDTRLEKVSAGSVDATLLAVAGLKRLGKEDVITEIISTDQMLPAISQGVIGIQSRHSDDAIRNLLIPLNHEPTETVVCAERAFLTQLEGSCETPIAGLGTLNANGTMNLEGLIAAPDGTKIITERIEGVISDAQRLGKELGLNLLKKTGSGYLVGR